MSKIEFVKLCLLFATRPLLCDPMKALEALRQASRSWEVCFMLLLWGLHKNLSFLQIQKLHELQNIAPPLLKNIQKLEF